MLLSLLVLFVIVAIVFQISVGTNTDSRVARNDVALTTMDLAIESALLEVEQMLIQDAEQAAAEDSTAGGLGGGIDGAGADPAAEAGAGAGSSAGEGAGANGPVDSRKDEFLRPQRTEINGIHLRILVQDESGKFNVLALADRERSAADEAEERLARVLDMCREDTDHDIPATQAADMAKEVRDFLTRRRSNDVPKPTLLSDDEEEEDLGFPQSLREFLLLEPFAPEHFRDFRDERGNVVHSIESYLTMWSALAPMLDVVNARTNTSGSNLGPGQASSSTPGSSAGPSSNGGGFALNLNTAPPVVLKGMFEESLAPHRLWDQVVEYRNLEEEEEESESAEAAEEEPLYDEFGEEIVERRAFDSLEELAEVDAFEALGDEERAEVERRLRVFGDVYSVYVTAFSSTSSRGESAVLDRAESEEDAEVRDGSSLVRTVRAVFWRRTDTEETRVYPLVRWEVLDYVPYEVLDYPEQRDR